MKTRKIWRAVPLAAGALVLLGLALSVRTSSGRPVLGHPGEAAPDLQFTTLDGQPWRVSDHRGQVVLLNFWATWCPPCRMETPGLVRVANEFRPRGLVVAGISMDDGSLDAVRTFARDYHMSYPVLLPPQDSPLLSQVESLPTSIFLDRQGRIAETWLGAVPEDEFRQEAERLLLQK